MKLVFFLFLWLPLLSLAQVSDDFSDGDFLYNPVWKGTTDNFIVNNTFQLQLHDTVSGESWLTTRNQLITNTEWHFWIKYSFSPSKNNFGRIYLVSDTTILNDSLNGYFIQLGESGSNDALELFKQQGAKVTSICRGTDGLIASSFTLGIKVLRDNIGNWQLFADPDGGENYKPEAQGFDNTITTTNHLGFYCKYTKSNSSKMYFDNVYCGPIIVDTVPPTVKSIYPAADSLVYILFDEVVDKSSAENSFNYLLNPTHSNPIKAVLNPDGITVLLTFSQHFVSGTPYTLSISGIKDIAGNIILPAIVSFSYYIPQQYDVVFNEIMADPSPPVGLPEFEYLELYNRTENIINLSDWKLIIGSSEKIFDNAYIKGGEYLIVGKSAAATYLSEYGAFYGFNSFSLKNTGQNLALYNASGQLICNLIYSDKWYNNPDKKNGGWSLEQINPDNICSQEENWKASVNSNGGTPGSKNSVFAQTELYPKIKQMEIPADNILRLWFTQSMDTSTINKTSAYKANKQLGNPKYVFTFDDEPNKVELYFATTFSLGKEYHLTVSKSLKNCMELPMKTDTILVFGLPDSTNENDIVINEVLFNPIADGVDYVELYNRSDKIIDVSKLLLGTVKNNPPNPSDTSFYEIVTTQSLYPPHTYRLLTSSPQKVMEQYYTENPAAFIQMESFPAYSNDNGTVILSNKTNKIIDVFNYSEKMQYPLLNYFDGVALERINFEMPTNDINNWHSASESVGFGTPGYKNSQYVNADSSNSNIEISIDPEIFSPDDDGYNDVTNISYRFTQPGFSITIFIFNRSGNIIRKLVENKYIGTQKGFISWNGLQDNNTKAPIGIYVVLIRIFDLNGNVKEYKKTVVVAGKL